MSHSDKPLAEHEFRFGGHTLLVQCRRLPDEVARVTQTLQLDVEELFANLLDWSTGGDKPEEQRQQQQQQPADTSTAADEGSNDNVASSSQQPHSKKLCGNVDSDQPDLVGLDVWPASIALCTYLSAHPSLVAASAVCELGAGMGLPGLLCAKLGAAHVLLTDYEPVVVEAMRHSAQRNGVAPTCAFLALDWFDHDRQLAPAQRAAFDLLLLADVIYAAAVVRPLVDTLLALLRPECGAALVAHRIRRPLVFDRVDKIARLQEQDEIFEDFKATCQAEGLHLRHLNDCPAAQAGDEPLLLAISASEDRLQHFPLVAPDAASQAGAVAAAGAAAAAGGQSGAASNGGCLDAAGG